MDDEEADNGHDSRDPRAEEESIHDAVQGVFPLSTADSEYLGAKGGIGGQAKQPYLT